MSGYTGLSDPHALRTDGMGNGEIGSGGSGVRRDHSTMHGTPISTHVGRVKETETPGDARQRLLVGETDEI